MSSGNACTTEANTNGGNGRTSQAGSGKTAAATPAQTAEANPPVTTDAASDSGGKPA